MATSSELTPAQAVALRGREGLGVLKEYALAYVSHQANVQQVEQAYLKVEGAMVELDAALHQVRSLNERLANQERSHEVRWASHRQDYDAACIEIARLREANKQLQAKILELKKAGEARDAIAEGDENRDTAIIKEAAEVAEWLVSVGQGKPGDESIGRGNFTVAAGAVQRLLWLVSRLQHSQNKDLLESGELAVLKDGEPYEVIKLLAKIIDREQRARLAQGRR